MSDGEGLFFVVSCTDLKHHVIRVVQRGEAWLLQCIQHTAGIYGFFTSLALAARRSKDMHSAGGKQGSCANDAISVGEQWYNLRPDALAEYRVGQQRLRFWLEWDRGTMNVRDLAIKFTSYAALYRLT